ncbi:hypothetical protein [Fructobacillus ficulneus]|uniref:Stage III sporulation protein E n=1 Tax=Fructobacillus ficulneus TaxID=157463 RepID=A0A0K8MFC0_9LACO|nr:hypothetical protein [Fructobacillus ficulneus]GAO99182.1 stage III sporulation protein E [Fructobacillus ficulneus]
MKKVEIQWNPWVQKLSKTKLWSIFGGAIVILLALLGLQFASGNEPYNPNWFVYCFTIFYAFAFCPIGEQMQFRLFPKSIPHNQYQVTTWGQWKQAMLISFVLIITSLLFWPIQKQGEIAIHLIAALIAGFLIMWGIRMVQGMLANKKG